MYNALNAANKITIIGWVFSQPSFLFLCINSWLIDWLFW
jgi:hypothetical protein